LAYRDFSFADELGCRLCQEFVEFHVFIKVRGYWQLSPEVLSGKELSIQAHRLAVFGLSHSRDYLHIEPGWVAWEQEEAIQAERG
jgi:hypothetical protein